MGMTGMGSNGLGLGVGPANLPPGLLQMLMQQGAGGGIAPQIQHFGQAPMAPNPVGPMQQPLQPTPTIGTSIMGANGQGAPLQGLLAALKGNQQGIAPQGSPGNGMFPSMMPGGSGAAMQPGLLQMLGNLFRSGAVPGSGAGNFT